MASNLISKYPTFLNESCKHNSLIFDQKPSRPTLHIADLP